MIILGIKVKNIDDDSIYYNFWLADKNNVLFQYIISTKSFEFGKKLFEQELEVYENVFSNN